jgi:hypothetical protein
MIEKSEVNRDIADSRAMLEIGRPKVSLGSDKSTPLRPFHLFASSGIATDENSSMIGTRTKKNATTRKSAVVAFD